jgi:DNA polymerase III epsilon subunit-like protein
VIIETTGITPLMVVDARPPEAVLGSFLDWAGAETLLVVHNAPFDCNFVVATCRRAGMPEPDNPVVDTLEWARQVDLPVKSRRLGMLAQHFGVAMNESHRALADARAVGGILNGLLQATGTPAAALPLRARTMVAMAAQGQAEWLEPATPRQLDYLRSLGASREQLDGLTKRKASTLIDTLKNRR